MNFFPENLRFQLKWGKIDQKCSKNEVRFDLNVSKVPKWNQKCFLKTLIWKKYPDCKIFSKNISKKKLLRKGKKYENKLYHNSWGSTNCICGSNLLSFGLSQNIKWHQIRLDSIYTSNFIFLVQIEHFLEHLRITWYSFCHISHSWGPKKTSESLIWSILIDNGVEFILKSVP